MRQHSRSLVRAAATLGLTAASVLPLGVLLDPAIAASTCRAVNLTSESVPTSDLQRVLDRADPGDRIRIVGRCIGSFDVLTSVTLLGHATTRFPRPTLDGGGGAFVLRVRDVDLEGIGVTVKDLRVTGGGHGLVTRQARLALAGDTVVVDNHASDDGGGIDNRGGTVIMRDRAVVRGNTARDSGGGIANHFKGTLTVREHAAIRGNAVRDGAGGGIHHDGVGTITLENHAEVSGNSSTIYGGGIWTPAPLVLMDNATVTENVNTGDDGGGIVAHGPLTITDSATVTDNYSARIGGGILVDLYDTSSPVTISGQAEISHNRAIFGGGIYIQSGSLTLEGSATVRRNVAARRLDVKRLDPLGGGVYNVGVLSMYDESSIRANTSEADGGGIYNRHSVYMWGASTVVANSAERDGGGYGSSLGTSLQMADAASLSGNSADQHGGGAYTGWSEEGGGASVTLSGEATISGNSAEGGGGVFKYFGSLTLNDYSSIRDNTATVTSGGGVFTDEGFVTLNGQSTVTGNTAATYGGGIANVVSVITVNDLATVVDNIPDDCHDCDVAPEFLR